jgi:epoxyqueuosine reductase
VVANDDEGHRPLPYRVEHGGTLFKDAAALAGLGTIGKNNLVITPEYGPHVRLKAMFLDVDLEPTGPIDFTLCEGCDILCRGSVPRKPLEMVPTAGLYVIHKWEKMRRMK